MGVFQLAPAQKILVQAPHIPTSARRRSKTESKALSFERAWAYNKKPHDFPKPCGFIQLQTNLYDLLVINKY